MRRVDTLQMDMLITNRHNCQDSRIWHCQNCRTRSVECNKLMYRQDLQHLATNGWPKKLQKKEGNQQQLEISGCHKSISIKKRTNWTFSIFQHPKLAVLTKDLRSRTSVSGYSWCFASRCLLDPDPHIAWLRIYYVSHCKSCNLGWIISLICNFSGPGHLGPWIQWDLCEIKTISSHHRGPFHRGPRKVELFQTGHPRCCGSGSRTWRLVIRNHVACRDATVSPCWCMVAVPEPRPWEQLMFESLGTTKS